MRTSTLAIICYAWKWFIARLRRFNKQTSSSTSCFIYFAFISRVTCFMGIHYSLTIWFSWMAINSLMIWKNVYFCPVNIWVTAWDRPDSKNICEPHEWTKWIELQFQLLFILTTMLYVGNTLWTASHTELWLIRERMYFAYLMDPNSAIYIVLW